MKWYKKTALGLAAGLVFLMPSEAMAAERITSVSLEIETDFQIGDDCSEDDIIITPKSGLYYVDDIELLNEVNEWGNADTPRIDVYLQAEDGYYFSVSSSDIRIEGGTYETGRREDSYTLVLTLRLPSLLEQVGEIESASWTGPTTISWSEAYNTAYYEIRAVRNGKNFGMTQKTTETTYDLGQLMSRDGTYGFRVRAVNIRDNSVKSEWKDSAGTVFVDSETAARYRQQYGSPIPEGVTEPGQMEAWQQSQIPVGWNHDGKGWWYKNSDGSYTVSNWQLIDDMWFYFDSEGYMVTGWILWNDKYYYCTPEYGNMLTDTIVPDGSGRRVDSTGAWIQ